eukprot:CAMPEP_0115078444 /NCGR_PEP_ID=MMETSP0227-20121206/17553_1 /TAXON_ID=89957 /ORGANISM="Polarella glacialis, Strain CCMP 1383" /LENGTH=411 /DNA_ID=CAMNT_0002465831 /DNA_START=176 /DNA_END=1411 /DNA_ORIENTATION=-
MNHAAVAAVMFVSLFLCSMSSLNSSVAYLLPGTSGQALRRQHPDSEGSDVGSTRRSLLAASLGLAVSAAQASDAARAISAEELRVTGLFLRTTPSVLGIGEMPQKGRQMGQTGTGFVWDSNHVVTNYHVAADLKDPHITFLTKDADGDDTHVTVKAYLVGADPLSDTAILALADDQVDLTKLMRPLQRGASNQLKPGQEVYAVGNPFGLEHSMSRGIISGVSRTMDGAGGRPINGVIQTDASINPGNSGGPLLNSEGQVIGMNTAILSTTGTFSGVGFAVPIDTVERNVKSMISEGYVSRPSLGVVFAPDGMSQSLGVGGAMVLKLVPGGPAQRAGLRAARHGQLGDVIVSIGGRHISTAKDIFALLEQKAPGEDIILSVQRPCADEESDQFEQVDLTIKLGTSNSRLVAT